MEAVHRLIKAATEINRLSTLQRERTLAWQKLAMDVKAGALTRVEIAAEKSRLDSTVVIDFGTAIDQLNAALKPAIKEMKRHDKVKK